MAKGSLALILHAHLPFVHHPEYDDFLEERWFFEAVTETYIPIIKFCDQLLKENIDFKITFSISPSLLAMMENPDLQNRYLRHLEKLIELSAKELERTRFDGHLNWLANMYHTLFREARSVFVDQYDKRLASAFKKFHDHGVMELMTTAATHGFLPILSHQPVAVSAQIKTGITFFEKVFGFRPQGLWLPECGYYKGLEDLLAEQKIRYFIVESHAIHHASTSPFYGVYAPMFTPTGVAAFGREQNITKQVWSAQDGFPGHPDYREFYRDIGFDLDYNYIHPYICGDIRVDTGIKYYRITGRQAHKHYYNPDYGRDRAAQHAGEFVHHRIAHVEHLAGRMETPPIIIAPFDAELFGHWWFEGPQWLNFVIRKIVFDQKSVALTTPSIYLNENPVQLKGTPATSTWGHKGYFEVWLNKKNDWIYPHLFQCAARMERLAKKYHDQTPDPRTQRALNQCARELLLAQSSDWPFIIANGTSAEYATRRVKDHIARFTCLANQIETRAIDDAVLLALETMDDIFPNQDFTVFAK